MTGYWLMTCMLAKWISPVGSGILILCLMIFSLFMIVGAGNIVDLLTWCSERIIAVDEEDGDFDESPAVTPRQKPATRKTARDAAKAASEDAKEARRIEREEQRRLRKKEVEKKRRQKAEEKVLRKQGQLKKKEEERLLRQASEVERIRMLADNAKKDAVAATQRRPVASSAVRRQRPAVSASVSRKTMPQQKVSAATDPRQKKTESAPAPVKPVVNYMLPPVDLLDPVPNDKADHGGVEEMARELVTVLNHFKIPCKVVGIKPGPVVTQYELEPAPHIRVERISSLSNNLKMSLAATSLRVEAPIPGRKAVGIEIPNKKARSVTFRSIIESAAWQQNKMQLPLAVGKDVSGDDFIYDLAKAPHMLVAGATGSGKSVCLNAFLCGLLIPNILIYN
jgi:S-DNA-T family DNA segregation ATPase FtsK/SpoIIIE